MQCRVHGETGPAILCSHLAEAGASGEKQLGWVQAQYDPQNREPGDLMAWCLSCHKTYEKDGGWNQENDFVLKVVCQKCFSAIKLQQNGS